MGTCLVRRDVATAWTLGQSIVAAAISLTHVLTASITNTSFPALLHHTASRLRNRHPYEQSPNRYHQPRFTTPTKTPTCLSSRSSASRSRTTPPASTSHTSLRSHSSASSNSKRVRLPTGLAERLAYHQTDLEWKLTYVGSATS